MIEVKTIQWPTENKYNDKQWSTNTTQKTIHKIVVIGQQNLCLFWAPVGVKPLINFFKVFY
jgi:hypothetical protein